MTVADEGEEDHGGHHLPATDDWPRGFGEASWWPFVAALGATGIYVGALLFILGQGAGRLIGPVAGPAIVVGSIALLVVGLVGWLYHAFVVGFWTHRTDGHSYTRFRLATLLFLVSEIGTFGAGFVYYFFIRTGAWNPAELPHLLSSLVLVNTVVLLSSSVTLHYAHLALRDGNRRRFLRLLWVTLLLGVVFVAGQAFEYYEFVVETGFTIWSGAYGSAFFGLTGLHGLHVSLGVVLLGIVLVRAIDGQFSDRRHTAVATVTMYWHFVDLVWVFLVVVLYAGAAVTL